MEDGSWLKILVVIALIYLNGTLASAEIALVELSEAKLKRKATDGDKKAGILLSMKQNPSNFLSTIQIGITLAGILSGAFAADSLAQPIVAWAVAKGVVGIALGTVETVSVLAITLIITYVTLVFGELVPKRVAMVRPEKTAYRVASFINGLSKVTKPLVSMLSSSTNGVLRLIGIDPNEENDIVTEDEILMMIQEGNEQGTIHDTEVEFVSNLFEFTDMRAEEIMTHRTEIAGISVEGTIHDVIGLMSATTHTRYPVYEGSLDKIVGVIHSQDIIALYQSRNNGEDSPEIKDIMRTPYFVSESKPLVELFNTMKKSRNHMAVVVDEYGGTSGIVTIMDVIEEIVGDIEVAVISDDFIQENENGEYLIDGLSDMEEVINFLKLDLDDDKYDTLSGFIIGSLGYIPDGRQQPEFTFGNYIFRIEQMDGALVRSVRVRKPDAL